MLNGNFFRIYIHSSEPAPMQMPVPMNHQLVNSAIQNSRVQAKLPIRCKATFSITCPAESKALCAIASINSLHISLQNAPVK